MSPSTSSTCQIDSDAPQFSTKLPYELRSQAEKIDEKSVAEAVKPAEAEHALELSKDAQPQVAFSAAKVEMQMARMAKECEERAATQKWMYAQQNKMFEFILSQMVEMSAAKEKPQTGQSGSGDDYEAGATRRARHENARETRDCTNGRGRETTGPRESSGGGSVEV
jgi:hypothetical protein